MTWFKIDDDFFFHPKVIAAGNSAIGLFVRCGSWASNHLTDGFIPDKVIEMFGNDADITRLVEVGLLEETDGDGYLMPAFLDYNPSADEVKATRAASAERQRQSRGRRSDDPEDVTRDSHVTDDDVTRDSRVSHKDVTRDSRVSHSAPTRPDPTHIKPPPPGNTQPVDKVVVAASKKIIEISPPSTAPKKRHAYLAAMQRRLRAEHPDIVDLLHAQRLEDVVAEIVRRETEPEVVELHTGPPPPTHDPDCEHCAGSGWRTVDHDALTVGRCDCEPSYRVATVSELRRTS